MTAIGSEKPGKPEQPEKNNGFHAGWVRTTRKHKEKQWFACWLNLEELHNQRSTLVCMLVEH